MPIIAVANDVRFKIISKAGFRRAVGRLSRRSYLDAKLLAFVKAILPTRALDLCHDGMPVR